MPNFQHKLRSKAQLMRLRSAAANDNIELVKYALGWATDQFDLGEWAIAVHGMYESHQV